MKARSPETAAAQTRQPFTPEFELLLCSARTVPDAPRIDALANSGIDWPVLFDLADRHGLHLLVYNSLRAVCWDRVPGQLQAEWQNSSQALTRRNLRLTAELLRITAEFQTAGIPVAVLKGSVLAEMVYGDFTLREFGDFDLLIRETDFFRTVELLQRLSYQPLWNHDLRKVFAFLRSMGEYPLTNSVRGTDVDLHWRVAHKSVALSPTLSDFPSGFQPVTLAGSTVLSFAPHDLPLYLAAQGGADQWCDLRRICDLAEFVRAYPAVDWEPHLQAARRLGGLRSMLTGLALACDLFNAELPLSITGQIHHDPVVSQLAEGAIQNLQNNVESGEPVSRYLFQLRAKQGLRGKLAIASSILIDRTTKDGSWIMLPRPLWWLYPLLRPLRMSRRLLHRE